jgi:hypothetical protein
MRRLHFIGALATVPIAVSTAQLHKKNEPQIGTKLLVPCGPDTVKNGSFEASNFNATALLFLNDANNCVNGASPCLDAWQIPAPPNSNPNNLNLLAWAQIPLGISGVPPDPINSPTDRRFINLSGQKNTATFPTLSQTINLAQGIYEVRFKVGQGSDPRFGYTSPVSVDLVITGGASGGSPSPFTTDPNGPAWQDFMWRFGTNGSVQLHFSADPHAVNQMKFVGLDNVSVKGLFEPGSRACLLGTKTPPTIK